MNIINNCSQPNLEKIVFINQQEVKLTITGIPGTCCKCQIDKEIKLISQNNQRAKKYCWTCAWEALYRLEQSNYQFTDKEQLIKELREELNSKQIKKWWSDYYTCKKPTCFTCLQQGIKENEYSFCGDNCLVKDWIKYHGQVNLKRNVEN